jgi:hypothetical protein
MVWLGKARRVSAGYGMVWHGMAIAVDGSTGEFAPLCRPQGGSGETRLSIWLVSAWSGMVRPDLALFEEGCFGALFHYCPIDNQR